MIKVADGPLTSKLQQIKEGDTILVGRKATGTLIADNLFPGQRLLLLSTGTGLAPFASLIKDPEVYERYETIVLVHGCRQVSELAYGEELVARLRDDELFGPLLTDKPASIRPSPASRSATVAAASPISSPWNNCSTISICRRWISIPTVSLMWRRARPCWGSCARCSRRAAFSKAVTASPAIL